MRGEPRRANEARERADAAEAAAAAGDRDALTAGGGPPVPHAVEGRFTARERAAVGDAARFAGGLLGGWFARTPVAVARSRDEHAEWEPGRLHLPADARPEDVCHELGHEAEHRLRGADPAAARRLDAFHKARFPRGRDVRLADRFPGRGFAPDEVGNPDALLPLFPDDPPAAYYAGKRYPGGMTEVVTTGLELLWLRPKAFAEADPGYFGLMIDLLRGAGG